MVEINVNAHSLGIEVARTPDERVNDILIPKNTQLPGGGQPGLLHRRRRTSRGCASRCCRARRAQADACIPIGECWIDGLPPNLPKGSPVQVRCGGGGNGLIDVMALDMTSGKMARAEIHRSSGLSDDEIAREAAWVKGLRVRVGRLLGGMAFKDFTLDVVETDPPSV